MTRPLTSDPGADPQAAILCRFGELFLKHGNRSRFQQMLVRNVKAALDGIEGARVNAPHGRILARVPPAALDEACRRLQRVFGLVSVSPVVSPDADLDAITHAAIERARAAIARDPQLGRSFKVATRRSDKSFPHRSYEISAAVGARIQQTLGLPVDVHQPALTVGIEISSRQVFVFAGTLPAPGGLPVGTAGRALLLLSGGIDSPAAGWLAAKRGLAVHGIYFHSPPFVGEKTRDKVVQLARRLGQWQAMQSLTVVNFTEVQKKLREHGKPELAVVLYRRMMMRIADRVADRLKCDALITGENLAQVASQTLPNLTTIEAAARRLVLRPLITFDKVETIRLAERIGTFDLSIEPYDDCCSLFVPRHPATGARVSDAERAERRLDVDAEADAAAATAVPVALDAPG